MSHWDRPGTARIAALRPFFVAVLIRLALLFTGGAALAQDIDASSYDALLHLNVKDGVVNYAGFQDSTPFKDYVAALAVPAELPATAEQVAYNINAYNALAIQGILDGLSPSSLLGRLRYFKLRKWPLDGRGISLYDLEHAVLRPLGEPRIHFAIVCASKSCPFLRSEAYTATRLDQQLDAQARAFVNDPSRNRFDKTTRTAHLSEIFKWFDEDFRGAGSVQKYLAKYVSDADIATDLAQNGYNVEWIPYDWTLNGTPPRS